MRITRRPIFVIAAFTSTALAVSCGDDHLSPAPAGKVGNARSALTFTADPSTKICQLTGTFDRQPPHLATAQQRSGVPSTVEGPDLGYVSVRDNEPSRRIHAGTDVVFLGARARARGAQVAAAPKVSFHRWGRSSATRAAG